MRTANRLFSIALTGILVTTLAFPGIAFGTSDKSKSWKDKEHDTGKPEITREKEAEKAEVKVKKQEIKEFQATEGKHIRVNKKGLTLESPPVIKDGRTLIPVRAVTEAMGAKVAYDDTTSVVTITSADGKIIILFYLAESDNGKITVTKDGATKDVTTDVRPGLINNRTFVPLRFIAETLGLKVSHDEKTGDIDIDDDDQNAPTLALALTPAQVSFANREVLTSVAISYSQDAEYDLVSIKSPTVTLGSGQYTTSSNTVTLAKSYVESLTADSTTLTLTFKDSKNVTVDKTFVIQIDQDGVYAKPVLSPLGVKYFSDAEIADTVITATLNGHTLKEVRNGTAVLTAGTAYSVDGGKITVKKAFIQGLPAGQTVLTLVFEIAGKDPVTLSFTIEK